MPGECIVALGLAVLGAPDPGAARPGVGAADATVAVEPVVASRAPDAGCPPTIADLPPSDVHDPSDPRLRGAAVVVVTKSVRRISVFRAGVSVGCWAVGLGFAPAGDKRREGDGRTPEGWYRTSDKRYSRFADAIAIHYPNRDDARRGKAARRISAGTRRRIEEALERRRIPPQQTALGGAILIHGGGGRSDWTLGCVALDDEDLVALRAALPVGMRTDILLVP